MVVPGWMVKVTPAFTFTLLAASHTRSLVSVVSVEMVAGRVATTLSVLTVKLTLLVLPSATSLSPKVMARP